MPAAVGVAELSAAGPAPLRSPPVAFGKPIFPSPCLGFDLLIIWSRRKEEMDINMLYFERKRALASKGLVLDSPKT